MGLEQGPPQQFYQYAMFSVIYRFSIFGGQNTMGTDKERKE